MASPATLNVLSLCSGVDGLALGLAAALEWCGLGARIVCHVEREISAVGILAARMADGSMEFAPLWSDLRTFDSRPWRGVVDCLLAGYPCQPFSLAGKRQGERDPRHLFPEVLRVIDETGAPLVFLENVAAHLRMGFATVRGNLESRGYRVSAGLFSAAEVGASHRRERLFILAHLPGERQPGRQVHESTGRLDAADIDGRIAEMGNAPGDDKFGAELRDGTGRQIPAGGSGGLLAHTGSEHGGERRDEQPGQRGQPAPAIAGVPLADASGITGATGQPGSARAGRQQRAQSQRRGEALDDPTSARRDGTGRGAATDLEGGQCVSGEGCADVANTVRLGHAGNDGRGVFQGGGTLADANGHRQRAGGQPRSESPDAESGDRSLADTRGERPQGQRGGRPAARAARRAERTAFSIPPSADVGTVSMLRRVPVRAPRDARMGMPLSANGRGLAGSHALFAPGPSDNGWPEILARQPHLAPAIEPGVRVLADGTAVVVDQSRADQLRAAGNGVFPLCAAHAFITLARRAGLI